MNAPGLRSLAPLVAPGILVAATGVGAGDLVTASIAGSRVGTAVLWAAVVGGAIKWTLNEGIARWQMATGTTLLDGWVTRLPGWVQAVFMAYFFMWTLMVGGALVNACGVAGAAILPLGDPTTSKIIWGAAHSIAGILLVRAGGFRLFERVMALCTGCLFVGVPITAVLLGPDWGAVARGIAVPSIPAGGLPWTLAVLGGVGGTVTLMSYGYWIREKGRSGESGARMCRIDLAVAYSLTALFGLAMVLIGTRIQVEGQGTGIAVALADQLGLVLGPAGRWVFLAGFWGAVFSSLLGVWQSAPYLFADFVALRRRAAGGGAGPAAPTDLSQTAAYRGYVVTIGVVSLPLLWFSVTQIQLVYGVLGAMFMPFLAVTLLVLNNRTDWVGARFRNGARVNAVLVAIVVVFAVMGALQLSNRMPSFGG